MSDGRPDELFVPVAVRAMMIGALDADRSFYPQTLDYAKLRLNPSGSLVPTAYIARLKQMEKGIHLHWFLPNALSRGEKREGEDGIAFPLIPNRWQVFRLWREPGDSDSGVKLRCFTLESDALQMNQSVKNGNVKSPSVPYEGPGKQKHQFLGRSYPSDSPPKVPVAYLDGLTAVSAGNPYYTAYYPDCRNVLGFYDDMGDGKGGYLDHADVTYVVTGWYSQGDPLESVRSWAEYETVWKWQVPKSFEPGHGMFCHGFIDSLEWRGSDVAYPHNIPTVPPRIAVGNNTEEAMSALLAAVLPKKGYAERMMQHLLLQNCQTLQESNGILKSENVLMKRRFGEQANIEGIVLKPLSGDEEAPAESQRLVTLVNRNIQKMNHAYRELTTLRQSLYDAWYRYTQAAYAARVTPGGMGTMEECMGRIESLAPLLERKKEWYRIASLQKHKWLKRLEHMLNGSFRLQEQPGSRFWEPNNPVLLFADLGADPVRDEDGSRYSRGLLICRGAQDIRTEIVCPLPSLDSLDARTQLVLCEAVLLSASFTGLPTAGMPHDGFCRPGYCETYKAPWNPLFMSWQAVFYPDPAVGLADPSLENWRLQNNDYVYSGAGIPNDNGVIFRGFDLLSPHASRVAQGAAEAGLNDKAPKLEAVSQLLSDFHDQFQMIQPGLVMPVHDEVKNPKLARRVASLMDENSPIKGHMLPSFDGYYSPIRAGYLVFEHIHIIDSFGQIKVIEDPIVIPSEYLRSSNAPVQREVMLPPRILQPARLQVNWREDPLCPHVCGWLLPNLLEGTIAVYDHEGTMLGSLTHSDLEGVKVGWRRPPEEGGRLDALPFGIHPDLTGFLKELCGAWEDRSEDLLTPLLGVIDQAMQTINPQDAQLFNGLGTFLGRPLVLARASVAFELFETQRESRYLPGKIPEALPLLEQGRFSLRIGQRENQNDGVIGFFTGDDYQTLHLSAGYRKGLPSYFSGKNSVELPVSYPLKQMNITLLMDPTGEASFVSGLLPVKIKKLKQEFTDQAIRKLRYHFFLAPILTELEEMTLPYPAVEASGWSFSCFSPATEGPAVMAEIQKLRQANQDAVFSQNRIWAREGWMNLKRIEESQDG